MKFALVDGRREEARPKHSGICPACGGSLIAKCGEIRVHHWAHERDRMCDRWWENETEWHRSWKNQFPEHWQEFVHTAKDGEKHIADVRTDHGWVIEFQHSFLKPDERRSRDAFYSKLIWVIDGTRRKTDRAQFQDVLQKGIVLDAKLPVLRVMPKNCRLLNEWAASPSQVLADFGENQFVWWLLSKSSGGPMYVGRFPRNEFVRLHLGSSVESVSEFEKFVSDLPELGAQWEVHFRIRDTRPGANRLLPDIQNYLVRRKARTRF